MYVCIYSDNWEEIQNRLDEKMDDLAGEADEIESILQNKFGMIGGGRLLTGKGIGEAASFIKNLHQEYPGSRNFKHVTENAHNNDFKYNWDDDNVKEQSEDIGSDDSDVDMKLDTHNTNNNDNNNNTNNNNNNNNSINGENIHNGSLVRTNETKTQKFKRLERDWKKSEVHHGISMQENSYLAHLGAFYEQNIMNNVETNKKKKRKKRKVIRRKKSNLPTQDEFDHHLNTIKISLQSFHIHISPEELESHLGEQVNNIFCIFCTFCVFMTN